MIPRIFNALPKDCRGNKEVVIMKTYIISDFNRYKYNQNMAFQDDGRK